MGEAPSCTGRILRGNLWGMIYLDFELIFVPMAECEYRPRPPIVGHRASWMSKVGGTERLCD